MRGAFLLVLVLALSSAALGEQQQQQQQAGSKKRNQPQAQALGVSLPSALLESEPGFPGVPGLSVPLPDTSAPAVPSDVDTGAAVDGKPSSSTSAAASVASKLDISKTVQTVARAGARSIITSGVKNSLLDLPLLMKKGPVKYAKKVAYSAAQSAAVSMSLRTASFAVPQVKVLFILGVNGERVYTAYAEDGVQTALTVAALEATRTAAYLFGLRAVVPKVATGFVPSSIALGVGQFVIDLSLEMVRTWLAIPPRGGKIPEASWNDFLGAAAFSGGDKREL